MNEYWLFIRASITILIIGVILMSSLSAFLYRLGGSGKGTLWRDIGCPLISLLCLCSLIGFDIHKWWLYLLSFGLGWGAMSMYFTKLFKPLDKTTWIEWSLTGLCYGISAFPLYWLGIHWYALVARTLLLTILITWWSEINDIDIWEERGRGFLFTSTMALLII